MKTEVKKLDAIKREIRIEVSGDIVKNKFNDVFKKIGQNAKVPGFRPGHAPQDILEKQYSSLANEEVLKDLLPSIYNEAVEKEKLDVIELPSISDIKLDRNSLSFKAVVEVTPQIMVKKYKGLKVNYRKISVSPDEVKRNIDSLKESRSIDTVDDNFARSLGYPDLEELKMFLERQIFIQKENQERQRLENQIIEDLIKDLDFELPKSLIDRQLESMLRQAKLDLALKGVPKEKIDEEENRLKKDLEPEAKWQVKIHLVFLEIAKKENIPVDKYMTSRVMEFLLKEANWIESS